MRETRPIGAADVSRFCEWIHDHCGLDFPSSRQAELERVIAGALENTGLPDVDALLALLADHTLGQTVLQEMIADLTVSETYFFRNQPQFHALEQHILPELIERRRPVRQLRIWSAGCATGEEPYSLAILLERLLADLDDWNIHLLATDINPDVLAKAQRGCYGEWSFRHVASHIKDHYFQPCGAELEIHPRLRSRVTFARLNLAEDAFPSFLTQTSAMDLILCRNVLIYFRAETIRRIVERFFQAAAEDGWLIVGHAEPNQTTFGRFAARNFPGTVVYQKDPTRLTPEPAHVAAAPNGIKRSNSRTRPADPARSATSVLRVSPRHEALEAETPPYQEAKRFADRMQWAEAEKWIAAALEKEPLSAAAHYLRGLILLETAQPDAALAALRNCLFADADFVMGHVALADLLARRGQRERARKALETAARLAESRPPHELVPEGDGLTAARLLEMVNRRKMHL